MALDATLAIFHHFFAFGLVGLLMAQWALLRGPADAVNAQRLARYDLFYGGTALLLLGVGLARVFFGLKGAQFYAASPFFWAKLALLAATAGVSVLPSLRYARWRKQPGTAPDAALWIATRKLVVIEAHLLSGVMICAALMARGIGL